MFKTCVYFLKKNAEVSMECRFVDILFSFEFVELSILRPFILSTISLNVLPYLW